MARVRQPKGLRGSLKWMQIAVNDCSKLLNAEIGARGTIEWLSPREADDYAEYSDSAFLELIGVAQLKQDLAEFWPKRGPQWDALARTDHDEVVIVEAKAHIAELFSPPTSAANFDSKRKIETALSITCKHLKAKPTIKWGPYFYQLANRLAHLMFLRERGVNAELVLLNFLNDTEMGGPQTPNEWEAAYSVAWHVLGLSKNHGLSAFVKHIYLDTRLLE